MRLSWKKKDDPKEYGVTSDEVTLEALHAYRDVIVRSEVYTNLEKQVRLYLINDLILDATLRQAAAIRGGA